MSSLRAQLFAALLATTACGRGTEVGNGFKPPKGGSDDPAKKSTDTPATQDSQSGTDGAEDNGAGSGVPGATPASPAANSDLEFGLDFNIDLLALRCASPFAVDFKGPFKLAVKSPSGTLSDEIDANYSTTDTQWTLTNKDGAVMRKIKGDIATSKLAVIATDATGAATGSETCGGSFVEDDGVTVAGETGTFTRDTVYQVDDSGSGTDGLVSTRVAWFVKTDVDNSRILQRVEIGGTEAAPKIVLEIQPAE